ncbi:MAG: OadG family protein [Clostridia bacterium]|nr:OadG family protein [Clostridia bacterium]
MDQAIVVLITGLIVVFSMLVILSGVIKLYSTLVVVFSKKKASPKKQKKTTPVKAEPIAEEVKKEPVQNIDAGIPNEVIAAISAAVYYLEGSNAKVCAVKKAEALPQRSAWGYINQYELTRPF